ncbi:hypothetical protein BDZ91DRAFT_428079 [Kalaharituber pfeilii]|nr:hypothetical protein BDZ91DRAFT_428079 [Kalaharituber pfeilii]
MTYFALCTGALLRRPLVISLRGYYTCVSVSAYLSVCLFLCPCVPLPILLSQPCYAVTLLTLHAYVLTHTHTHTHFPSSRPMTIGNVLYIRAEMLATAASTGVQFDLSL